MNTSSVKIRMYRQGLGDCFLLTFPRADGSQYYVLIDCGVVMGGDPKQVKAAAADILNTTKTLNLVIGTHIHWDHVSGFCQAREIFDQLKSIIYGFPGQKIKPTGPLLKWQPTAQQKSKPCAWHSPRWAGRHDRHPRQYPVVLDFMGPEAGSGDGLAAARGACGTEDAMNYLRTRAGANVQYCTPATDPVHTLEGVPNVRIYTFGPPTDPKFLAQFNPSKTNPETYDPPGAAAADTALSAADSFLAAVSDADSSRFGQLKEHTYPFDSYYCITPEEAKQDDFFRKYYGFAGEAKKGVGDADLGGASMVTGST